MARKIDWDGARRRQLVWQRGGLSVYRDGWAPEKREEATLPTDRPIDTMPPDTRRKHERFEASFEFALTFSGTPRVLIVYHLIGRSEVDIQIVRQVLNSLCGGENLERIERSLSREFKIQNVHSKDYTYWFRMDKDLRRRKVRSKRRTMLAE